MSSPTNPMEPFSPFLPSTYNIPEDDDRLKTFLLDKFCNFADVINAKRIGAFTEQVESVNGEQWSYDTTKKARPGSQFIVRIPSFPNIGVATYDPVPNINPQFVITEVFGSASKPCSATAAGDGDYFSFMAQGDTRISFTMTDTTITITTTVDLSAYSGFIVIFYIRDGV